jgi:hypothetical protein
MGVRKTSFVERISKQLESEKERIVSVAYSVEKQKGSLQSLMLTLILNLRPDDPIVNSLSR